MASDRLLMYTRKSLGPRMDPCGTPVVVSNQVMLFDHRHQLLGDAIRPLVSSQVMLFDNFFADNL